MERSGGQPEIVGRRTRVVAVVCHLWCWLGPLAIVALVLRLSRAKSDPFLRAVTADVLNLQILALVPGLALVGLAMSDGTSLALAACWVAYFGVVLLGYVLGVIGAVQAWRGVAWRYPVPFRLVRSD